MKYLIEHNNKIIGVYDVFSDAELFVKSCIQNNFMLSDNVRILTFYTNSCYCIDIKYFNINFNNNTTSTTNINDNNKQNQSHTIPNVNNQSMKQPSTIINDTKHNYQSIFSTSNNEDSLFYNNNLFPDNNFLPNNNLFHDNNLLPDNNLCPNDQNVQNKLSTTVQNQFINFKNNIQKNNNEINNFNSNKINKINNLNNLNTNEINDSNNENLEENLELINMKNKKIELQHELNMIQCEKKKLEERKIIYDNDLKLFNLFHNDDKIIIPELFQTKFQIMKTLNDCNNLNFTSYYDIIYEEYEIDSD